MTDRQTDHATEKCVAIGGIACAVRAIAPKHSACASAVEVDAILQ